MFTCDLQFVRDIHASVSLRKLSDSNMFSRGGRLSLSVPSAKRQYKLKSSINEKIQKTLQMIAIVDMRQQHDTCQYNDQ